MVPGMLDVMIAKGFVRLDKPKQTKPQQKETTDGEIE